MRILFFWDYVFSLQMKLNEVLDFALCFTFFELMQHPFCHKVALSFYWMYCIPLTSWCGQFSIIDKSWAKDHNLFPKLWMCLLHGPNKHAHDGKNKTGLVWPSRSTFTHHDNFLAACRAFHAAQMRVKLSVSLRCLPRAHCAKQQRNK